MNLGPGDQIVGAWAEAPTGPGWSNRVVWVCVRNGLDGSHRVDALQPAEQTPEIAVLFRTACAVSEDLIAWVRGAAEVQRGKGGEEGAEVSAVHYRELGMLEVLCERVPLATARTSSDIAEVTCRWCCRALDLWIGERGSARSTDRERRRALRGKGRGRR